MFCLSESNTFYLYPYPTDMRKSFYSLSGIVTNEMKRNVQDGEAFIFVNRSLTSMKILHAEYASIQILGPTSADLQVAIREYAIAALYADASLPKNR